jgi:hypothetical protein
VPAIDRKRFQPDNQFGGVKGSLEIGGRGYEGRIISWTGDLERAWATAEKIVAFLDRRFAEIENSIREDLLPSLEMWLDEDDGVAPDELEKEVLDAMRSTDPVKFVIYDAGASTIFFDGPDFVAGHDIQVQFDADGQLVGVGLAG